MSEMNEETLAGINEYTVLSKYEGEAAAENLIEQIHIENGEIIKVDKFDNGELVSSEEVKEVIQIPITDAGRNHLVQAGIGAGVTPFNNANSYIGVGDSTTAFAAGQTDLQASTNKLRKVQNASYPTGSTNVLTFRSTFAQAEANFAWNEWGVFNASSGGTMLNRKVESLGTKTSTQTWDFTTVLTFTTA